MKQKTLKELIEQRRRQILIHSYIYYELNESIVPDWKWGDWAKELVELQLKHPEECSKCVLHDEFKDFDGSTGFGLQYNTEYVKRVAKRLLRLKGSSL